jgi:hypothetical protein
LIDSNNKGRVNGLYVLSLAADKHACRLVVCLMQVNKKKCKFNQKCSF